MVGSGSFTSVPSLSEEAGQGEKRGLSRGWDPAASAGTPQPVSARGGAHG